MSLLHLGFLWLATKSGKGQTRRDPTPGRSAGQDRLVVKHSEKLWLPTAHRAGSCTRVTPPAQQQGLQKGRRKESGWKPERRNPPPAAQDAQLCRDEQWHKSDGTSQLCRGRVHAVQKVQPPPVLLQHLHRDGLKVPPARGRVGIAPGGFTSPLLQVTLRKLCPHKGSQHRPPAQIQPWDGCRTAALHPHRAVLQERSWQPSAWHSRRRGCCDSGRRPCQYLGDTEWVPGGGAVRVCDRCSHRVSLSPAEFPLGQRRCRTETSSCLDAGGRGWPGDAGELGTGMGFGAKPRTVPRW